MRTAKYCNLKLLLIFLVVYGHMIEPRIVESEVLMIQYRWIYFVHMPLFSFISGLFINKGKECEVQLKKVFPLYVFLQLICMVLGDGQINFLTPFWHLWYLLSYCCWLGIAWLWFKFGEGRGKMLVFACSILLGCFSGIVPFIGRVLSLSRTFVFFPYFWLGVICNPAFHWKKLRKAGVISLLGALVFIFHVADAIPVEFLYHAEAFVDIENGVVLRLVCYIVGIAFGLFFLVFIPGIRFPFTRAGANTMPVYLAHAPIAMCFRRYAVSWEICLLVSIGLIYGIDLLMRWRTDLYGIVVDERRKSRWLHFRKSTKNMRSPSIVSYYP